MPKVKGIIFDWGGVFVDADTKERFPGSEEILQYLRDKSYCLGLVVIASEFETRKKQIEESDLRQFFEIFRIAPITKEQIWDPTLKTKDFLFKEVADYFGLPKEQIMIIDDRTVRGIRYANENGHQSIWVCRGKFCHELPNEKTGQPTYTVKSLEGIINFL